MTQWIYRARSKKRNQSEAEQCIWRSLYGGGHTYRLLRTEPPERSRIRFSASLDNNLQEKSLDYLFDLALAQRILEDTIQLAVRTTLRYVNTRSVEDTPQRREFKHHYINVTRTCGARRVVPVVLVRDRR